MRISDWSSDVCSSDLFHWHATDIGNEDDIKLGRFGLLGDLDILVEVHVRSEEHTSELQSLMRISYAVFCLKKKKTKHKHQVDKNENSKIINNHYPTNTQNTTTQPNTPTTEQTK